MAEILETVMLICFGLSWPVSLIKTLRAKSAKSSSISFMCLILVGYTAGIIAKVMTTGCNFVFYVYIFNVVMVLANLIVTLKNRAADERSTDKAQKTHHPKTTTALATIK